VPSGALPDPFAADAVLLDMDGTLVDTEGAWFDAERAVAARYGVALPRDAEAVLHGLDVGAILDALIDRYGVPAAPDRLRADVNAAVADALRRTSARPGAAAFVAHLAARDHPRAVVSNAPRAAMQATLAPHPFDAALAVRISVDDVAQGKPAADPYLAAAARLGVAPERALAVEDSLPGATAARAAGVPCVLLTHGVLEASVAREVTPYVATSFPDAWPHLVRDSEVTTPRAAHADAAKEAP